MSDSPQQLEGGAYEVIRTRLDQHAAMLRERVDSLNAARHEVFGSIPTELLSTGHVATPHNCVARDLVGLGGDLYLLGYNIQFGLKQTTELADVFAVCRLAEQGTFHPVALEEVLGAAAFNDPARVGENAFAAQRYTDDGELNREFVLNRPPYDQAGIIIAGANFGCGSSREAAVWCLGAIGIRCIVATSFGDIFRSNCFQNGLLPVQLGEAEVQHCLQLAETSANPVFDVDLDQCTLTPPDGRPITFVVGEYHRRALLLGLDEIGSTLDRLPAIETHEAVYWSDRPWLRPC